MTELYFMFVTIPLCFGMVVGYLDLFHTEAE